MKDKYRRASLAKALNESSHHVINRETLKRTRDTAVLINTGRGKLIDISAPIMAVLFGSIPKKAVPFDVDVMSNTSKMADPRLKL